jgi:peptidyl-prolyl cis-trans isomerase D
MLETMRNQAQSWIAKIILGGVALSFVLWGIGDYFRHSQVQVVASVDGTPISDSEFNLAYERQLNDYRALLGKKFSKKALEVLGVKQDTLQTLINRHLILSEAERMGLVAPQDVLLATVRGNPVFQSAGNFDSRRYEALTRNMGFRTPTDYEASLRLDLVADALQMALTQSATVSDAAVREAYARQFEKREIAALIVDPDTVEKKISIDDKQARAWFDAHRNDYRSPLRLSVNVVSIDPAKLAEGITVSDAEIQSAYDKRKASYIQPETRHARHILVAVAKDADEATRKAARTRIDKALQEIKAGKPFAEVAKQFSDDKATAKNGGDLGFVQKGATVPAFDAALFSLHKGEISSVIETRFGFHIIQLLDIQPAHTQTLAEVHDALKKELALSKADDEAYKLSQDLDDALGREDTLTAAANDVDLKVESYGPISLEETRAYPVFGSADYRKAMFERHPGDTIEVTEQDKGRYIAVEVTRRDEPANLPFEKVSARVYEDARLAAARDKARQMAKGIIAEAAATPLAKLAQEHAMPLYLSKQVRSDGSGDSDADWLSQPVLQAAFGLKEGDVAKQVLEVNKGFAIIQVKHVIAADATDFAQQEDLIRKKLQQSVGAVRFASWMANLRASHDIKIDQDVLAKL